MPNSDIELWLRDVGHRKGHAYLYQTADEVLGQLRAQDVQENPARVLFTRVAEVFASEIETSVSWASHPPATMDSYRFFRSLEVSGAPYHVSGGWARYLDRMIELLHRFHEVLLAERGWTGTPFSSEVAGKLASPLYQIRGSALRGPQFHVKIDANLTRLCSLFEEVGFFIPPKDVDLFSETDGPADQSIFAIEDDDCFRALLAGAAKSRDPNAKRVVIYFLKDEEKWVAELALKFLTTHFHEERG